MVSVADDGGSTGRLRAAEDRPAPGDLRKCLIALSDPESLLARTMEHRFGAGELEGHAFGNLLIVAASAETGRPGRGARRDRPTWGAVGPGPAGDDRGGAAAGDARPVATS